MEFIPIDAQSEEFEEAWEIYIEAFPEDEQRNLQSQHEVLANPKYTFYAITQEATIIALLAEWKLETCIFVEHFAIRSNLRNKGWGTKIFTSYANNKRIVIEVDPPTNKTNIKREEFWKSIGFHTSSFPYMQPAYDNTKSPVRMQLMSYPHEMNKENHLKIKKNIHTMVYGLDKPLENN